MLTTGRLNPDKRLEIGVSIERVCGWLDASTGDTSWLVDREGRDDDVAKIETSARTAVDANKMYWTKVQKIPEKNTGHLL